MRTRALGTIAGVLSLGLFGCGEPETKQVAPTPPDPLADVPAEETPTLDDGDWAVEQRGIALDAEDFAVLQAEESPAGVSVGRLKSSFKYLVLNLPALDYLRGGAGANNCAEEGVTSACVEVDNAQDARPLASAQAFLDRLKNQKDLEFSDIAVNVDLMDATHKRLFHLCGQDPFFGDLDYRATIVDTFTELADLPNLRAITVGAELNRYAFFRNEAGEPMPEDYVNLVTLYREIYAAVKARKPDILVGPGFSWDFFMSTSVPTVASEFGLSDVTSWPAVYRTWQRALYPFLVAAGEPGQFPSALSADFVGFTILPEVENDPFGGEPAPTDEQQVAAVEAYFRPLSRMGDLTLGGEGPIPVAFTAVDWPIKSAGFGNQKAPFLETFKRDVSHVDVLYAAWHRLADLPTMVQGQVSPCDRVMESYCSAKEFCNAGMITSSGNVRDTLDVITTDP